MKHRYLIIYINNYEFNCIAKTFGDAIDIFVTKEYENEESDIQAITKKEEINE